MGWRIAEHALEGLFSKCLWILSSHKKHENLWFMGSDLSSSKIVSLLWSKWGGPCVGTPGGLTGHYNWMLGIIRNMNNHGMPWRDFSESAFECLNSGYTWGTSWSVLLDTLCHKIYEYMLFRGENLNGFWDIRTFKKKLDLGITSGQPLSPGFHISNFL